MDQITSSNTRQNKFSWTNPAFFNVFDWKIEGRSHVGELAKPYFCVAVGRNAILIWRVGIQTTQSKCSPSRDSSNDSRYHCKKSNTMVGFRPLMGARLFEQHQSGGSALTQQFAFLSLIVIGLIALALSALVSYALRRDLLDREWGTTANFIRTGILQHLSPGDFLQPDNEAAQEHFEAMYAQAVKMPEISRVKFYDAGMRVVWSDEKRLVGQLFTDNPHLVQALSGRTVVNLQAGMLKEENLYEGNESALLVEVYVPVVFPGSTQVIGVVETYKVPTQVFASIRRGQMTVIGATAVGGILLYLSLFWIVRRAGRRIDEQHHNIESRNRELARANMELTAIQGQLLESERLAAIGEVVTAVAHGIRNPLANIRAAAQVAGLGLPGGPSVKTNHLAGIMSEVDRLEVRLKELLQFVRPAPPPTTAVDLNAVVTEALQMMAGRIAATQVQITLSLAPGLPSVNGNSMLLEQVVLSLLANAVEAMPAGGGPIRVATGLEPDSRTVFVEVRDSGTGIADGEIANLFKPFFTTKAQGTGLGLAIAKKFVEAHRGTIKVSSQPGEGAAFRVILPRRMEA
jgi:signal transduction histidine kinase